MERYFNREISWLSFNNRVLQEAEDKSNPLIERLRFLGIFSNNQDEFFRVRVASTKRLKESIKIAGGNEKFKASELLKRIQEEVLEAQDKFIKIYTQIVQELEDNNIFILNEKNLNAAQKEDLKKYFDEKVKHLLVPIMLDFANSKPMLSDHSIYLASKMYPKNEEEQTKFGVIKIPSDQLSRFYILSNEENKQFVILLDDILRLFIDEVYNIYNYKKIDSYTIKVTRDAELDISQDLGISFLEKVNQSVAKRATAQPVRVVIDEKMPLDLYNILMDKMKIVKLENVIKGRRYHNFKDFMDFPILNKALTYKPHLPIKIKDIGSKDSLLNYILKKDLMLYYPYHSFNYMVDLLREAAIDADTEYIKITMYRVSKNSKIMNALINAARNGKRVTVVVEIQARFDELNNINYANTLLEAGCKVVFANPSLKVHAKLCLIRKIVNGKKKYIANISNGNFHEGSSKIYTDFALFTASNKITEDVNNVFKLIERSINKYSFNSLIVSPRDMRERIYELINEEIRNQKTTGTGKISIKVNNLTDKAVIEKLYAASNAGVKINLLVRGICCLIPGIEGMSENIEVKSILGRFLEHARVFVFHQNGADKLYLSSADLMERNLDSRIEVMVPVNNNKIKKTIQSILKLQWNDNQKARIIEKNSKNEYKKSNDKVKIDSQKEIYNYLEYLEN